MLIDSHCHLHDREFFSTEQAENMLQNANTKGVKKIICIGTSHRDSLGAMEFASVHSDVYWTYGIHPSETSNNPRTEWHKLFDNKQKNIEAGKLTLNLNEKKPPVAIGEVGLDYHYAGYDKRAQIKLFEQMLNLAKELNLPLSFHVREAFDDFFPVVANFPKINGVVHSFSDSKKNLKRILNETNFYVGVNGMATYSTLPTPPLERIVLETDAPFLTPRPFRGIINEPAYVFEVAQWLAGKIGTDFKIIERETTKNARELFRI